MLDKHFLIKVDSIANENNVIHWGHFRITLLTERLFRVECSLNEIFRDAPTQSVWYRNFSDVKHDIKKYENHILITTSKTSIKVYKTGEIYAKVNQRFVLVDNKDNLLGTYRTLDKCDGDVLYDDPFISMEKHKPLQLNTGIMSKSGVAYFDDASSLSINNYGEVIAERGDGYDKYVFVYGHNYLDALKDFYKITGEVPMLPRFVFGNWWSRYHIYTDKEYLSILYKFQDRDVPLTVATIDMDWHYGSTLDEDFSITKLGRNTPYYGGNFWWTGYSWNKRLFKDYKKFLKDIKEMNLMITLNLHPADGVRWFEDCYVEFAKAMGIDPATCQKISFDIADTKFINAYFNIIHKPYEHDGVDFWWIDWQQNNQMSIKDLDPLWSLNHYHYLDIGKEKETPLILSRYCGIGSHRYPIGFSGDTFVTWETLDYLPYFTLTASNIGYTYWSHDIGGHMLGKKSDELYVRSVQFGVFSPINRLHCTNFDTMNKEPWVFSNGSGLIVEEYLKLRHKLIPFIYSYSYKTHKESLPLIQPLYYQYDNKYSYKHKNEYIFADQLIVRPITKSKGNNYFSKVKVYLPKGRWTDFFTNEVFDIKEDKEVTIYRTLEDIPVFVKEGGIIPISLDKGNKVNNPKNLEVRIYNGNNTYELYEDSNKNKGITTFKVNNFNNLQNIKISYQGDDGVVPEERVMRLYLPNIKEGEVSFFVNGQEEEVLIIPNEHLLIEFDFNKENTYEVVINYQETPLIDLLKENALRVLLKAEEDHMKKLNIYNKLIKLTSVIEIVDFISSCEIKKEYISAILEIL